MATFGGPDTPSLSSREPNRALREPPYPPAVADPSDLRPDSADALVFKGDVGDAAAQTKFNPYEDLGGLSAEDFLSIYQVNVVGAYQMVRAVAPYMKRQGHGAIQTRWRQAGMTPEQYQAFPVDAAAFVPLQLVPTAEQIVEALVWFLGGRLPPSSNNKATWDKL